MKKMRVLLAVMAAALMFGTAVQAASPLLLNEDFSKSTADLIDNGWTWTPAGGGTGDVEEGAFVIRANGETGAQILKKNIDAPKKVTIEAKIKLIHADNNTGASLSYNCNGGNAFLLVQPNRVGLKDVANTNKFVNITTEPGVWYTYYINIAEDGFTADLYRKREGAAEMEPLLQGVKIRERAGNRIEALIEAGANLEVAFDDVRVYGDGLSIFSQTFTSGGEEVREIPQGELTANAEITFSGSGAEDATLILAIFDRNNMIYGIQTASYTFTGFGTQILQATIDTSEIFADIQGGSAELYIWDSIEGMQPLASMKTIGF